jgi:hypothetical protein
MIAIFRPGLFRIDQVPRRSSAAPAPAPCSGAVADPQPSRDHDRPIWRLVILARLGPRSIGLSCERPIRAQARQMLGMPSRYAGDREKVF